MDERIQRRLDASTDAARRYLRPDEVIERARSQGIDLNDRTLKYYVSLKLLPEPERAPFNGADGRLRYFPIEIMSRLRHIQKYKEQGFSLTQIQKFLVNRAPASLRRMAEVEEQSGRGRPGRRLLKTLASEELRRLEADVRFQLAEGTGDEAVLEGARRYYTGLLAMSDSDEEPALVVEQFLRSASAREKERLLAPLRAWHKDAAREGQRPKPGLFRLALTLSSVLLVGRMDRKEAARLLGDAQRHVESVVSRYQEPRPAAAEEDIRRILLKGLSCYLDCFEQLRQSLGSRNRDAVRRGMASAHRAREILEDLETLTRQRRKLASLLHPEGEASNGDMPVPGS